ncbi:hypothetical protein ACQP3C_26555, partial [Escherichia coli]
SPKEPLAKTEIYLFLPLPPVARIKIVVSLPRKFTPPEVGSSSVLREYPATWKRMASRAP